MNIAAECRGFRALTLYFSACSCWYAWFIALSSHFASPKTCVAYGDATRLLYCCSCAKIPGNEAYWLQFGTLLLTYGSIPYGVFSIQGYVVECPSSTIGTKIPWGSQFRAENVTKSITWIQCFFFALLIEVVYYGCNLRLSPYGKIAAKWPHFVPSRVSFLVCFLR